MVFRRCDGRCVCYNGRFAGLPADFSFMAVIPYATIGIIFAILFVGWLCKNNSLGYLENARIELLMRIMIAEKRHGLAGPAVITLRGHKGIYTRYMGTYVKKPRDGFPRKEEGDEDYKINGAVVYVKEEGDEGRSTSTRARLQESGIW